MTEPEYLTIKDYADRFKLAAESVRRAIRKGVFPHRIVRPNGPRGWMMIEIQKDQHKAS